MNLQELILNSQELILGKIRSHLIQRCHHTTKSTSLQLRNMKIYAIKMPQQKPVKPCVFVLCCFYSRGIGSYPPSKTPGPLRAMLKQNELYIFRIGLGHLSGGLNNFEDKVHTY